MAHSVYSYFVETSDCLVKIRHLYKLYSCRASQAMGFPCWEDGIFIPVGGRRLV